MVEIKVHKVCFISDEEGMEWDGGEGSEKVSRRKEYDCVICNQTSPSTEDKPMGLAVLVQATSVLGHKRRSPTTPALPTSDEERFHLRHTDTLARAFDRRIEEFERQFDQVTSSNCFFLNYIFYFLLNNIIFFKYSNFWNVKVIKRYC